MAYPYQARVETTIKRRKDSLKRAQLQTCYIKQREQSFHANHHQFSLDRQRRVGRDVINSTASIDLSKYLADTPIAKQAIAEGILNFKMKFFLST